MGLFSKQSFCPYCFEWFDARDIVFRCINEEDKVQDDPELAAYLKKERYEMLPICRPARKNRWLLFGNSIPIRAMCESCGQETTKVLCPKCHNELPGLDKSLTVAVVGSSQAGKSNFIGVLVKTLDKEVLPNLDASLMMVGEPTRTRYRLDFETPLFSDHMVANMVRPTQADDPSVKYPMFFRIDLKTKESFFSDPVVPGINLNFFDTAGENLNDIATTTRTGQYIVHAQGIVLVIDPLQFESVRQQLAALGINVRVEISDQQRMIERIIELIKSAKGIPKGRKIKTPVAVAFSKLDAIRPLLKPGTILTSDYFYDQGLQTNTLDRIEEEVTGYMLGKTYWDIANIYNLINNNFAHRKFLAFSALGDTPDANNVIVRGVAGIRVCDPIIWLLHHLRTLGDD